MTLTDVRLFAARQGEWRGLLNDQPQVDDSVPTSATVPPAAARGTRGRALPLGTAALLDTPRYPVTPARPADPAAEVDRLGHVLVAALGLQRREPSNRFNDHRSIASVRSKFPVHAFVVSADGSVGYLDVYRHALIELPEAVSAPEKITALIPPPGSATVVLAARYTDLPTPYGRLRGALTLLELGINLRSLHIAADLFGVKVRQHWSAADAEAAGRLLAASGPGTWSCPLVVTVEGIGETAPRGPLAHAVGSATADRYREQDARLLHESRHLTIREAVEVGIPLAEVSGGISEPVRGVPDLPRRDAGTARLDWSEVLWNRTAGRTPRGIAGFSARPVTLGEDFLADLLAWAGQPAPGPIAEITPYVRQTVALQRVAGLPTGWYTIKDGRPAIEREDPELMRGLQEAFSYPLTPVVDCGLRHASAMWMFSADIDAVLREVGPAGWSLLQLWCGWTAHGITTAAAAHGLFARPARSFEEYRQQHLMGLPRELVPVFSVTCGRPRFAEPMLDLRT